MAGESRAGRTVSGEVTENGDSSFAVWYNDFAMKKQVTILSAVLSLCVSAFAEAPKMEAVFTLSGGRTETRAVAAEPCGERAWRFRLPKESVPEGTTAIDLFSDRLCGRSGGAGWYMSGRGNIGVFEAAVTNSTFNLASHPWLWQAYYSMATPEGVYMAILDGYKFEASVRMRVKDGVWTASPRYDVKKSGFAPYEDVTVTWYEFPAGTDYNTLAKAYRRHRAANDPSIRPMKERMRENPHLEKLCRSVHLRCMHAIKRKPTDPEPKVNVTFDRELELLKELKAAGVDDLSLCVAGWQFAGYDGACPSVFPVPEALGGEEALRRLVRGGQELGYIVDAHSNYTDCYPGSPLWNDGDIACKDREGKMGKNGVWAGGQAYNLCLRNAWEKFIPEQLDKMAELGFRGAAYVDVFSCVTPYRCCDPRHPANSAEQAKYQLMIVEKCRKLFGGFASEMNMDHMIGHVDYMNYASTSIRSMMEAGKTGKKTRFAKIVPFYELAFHDVALSTADRWTQGYVSGDKLLKNIEFGGRPILYSYDRSKLGDMKRLYAEFVKYRHLMPEEMTRHAEVAPNVFRTSYANGESTLVNYNETAVTVDGTAVPAKGWTLCRAKAASKPVVILNQDCSEFQAKFPAEKMTAEGAEEYFDAMNCGGNTHLFINPQAHNAVYPSKVMNAVWEPDPRVGLPTRGFRGTNFVELTELPPLLTNSKLLAERGVDFIRVWIDRARAKGVSPWLSMRMNDVHDMFLPSSSSVSTFWLDHPECRIVPGSDGWRNGKPTWRDAGLDYAHPEVRARSLAIAREMLEKWDVDGIEFDWMRFSHHVSAKEELEHTGHRHLTAFMRDVKRLVDEIAAKRGRKIRVAARVASRPEVAFGLGTDAETWAREGLVDWIIASEFLYESDFALPCMKWKSILARANPSVKFFPGIDATGVRRDGISCGLTRPELCGYFERMFAEGADGAYFFNYFICDRRNPASRLVHVEGLGSEAKLRDEARTYPSTYLSTVCDGLSIENPFPARLDRRWEFHQPIGRVGAPSFVRLRLVFDRAVEPADLGKVTLNGSKPLKTGAVANHPNLGTSRQTYDLDYPLFAPLDGDNCIRINPFAGPARLLHLDLMLGPRR